MADVISAEAPSARRTATPEPDPGAGPAFDVIELLFFAYRDFVRDADEALVAYGFGRAHHRVLHFVDRNPGLTVTELLDILKITKQSLGRVLRELVEKGFIESRENEADRRQRLLRLTPEGQKLEQRLFDDLHDNMLRAYTEAGEAAVNGYWLLMQALMSPEARAQFASFHRKDR